MTPRMQTPAHRWIWLSVPIVLLQRLYWLGMYEKCHPPWMRRWLFSAPNTQTPRSLGNEWHYPRLTTYRTVALTFPILFGSWKAVLTYMGHQTPPNMLLDWQIGIVGILWLFWLGWFEECHPEWMHLIFAEDNNEQDVPKRYPGFTVYRVLVMIVIASFVISKAVQTSEGEYLGANWVDVILVVFCIPGLFWLGLYQKNCPESWRWFFVDEYCSSLCVLPAGISFVLV
ncbi:hypothetical protein BD410DRAFT_292196 [Rickenella mellea]|uniref:Uncharacterized protein n=1 Tax=Rickenella mellea TaxID=50990 RepID=A0A4Y7Q2U3_9AGAM|nr:hypothetical protein BD410DRAFT_292196 [Rickenella mellea]